MKHLMRVLATAVCVLVFGSIAAAERPTDEQVTSAIDRGVQALLAAQNDKGWWSDNGTYKWRDEGGMAGGYEVCAMLALAYAGVSMNDPKMAKGFDELLKFDMHYTYTCSLRIMTISKLLPKLPRELRSRALEVLKKDAEFLVVTQRPTPEDGPWSYPNFERNTNPPVVNAKDAWWDFSNTQMAILGLSEAIKAGLEIPEQTMLRAQNCYLKNQLEDGGWNYGTLFGKGANLVRDTSYGSMTAAAVASLFITRDYLYGGLGCPCKNNRSSGRTPQVDKAIDNGLAWLGKYFEASDHPAAAGGKAPQLAQWIDYWLYACERAGLASGMKYFGGHDWYAEGAEYFIRKQNRNGEWGRTPNTCYAICFLVKGRAPILFNKLQFDGEWNNHSRDVANLAAYIAHLKEQPIQWQVINLTAPVEDWHDAPILYITAESELNLTAENKAKLRQFTDSGGTILFEASCGSPTARKAWEQICSEVWPEWELKLLEKEHPVFSADQEMKPRLPVLHGADDGMRTFLFVSWQDLSCAWNSQAMAKKVPQFQLGGNLYVYATDHRPLRARLAERHVMKRKSYMDTTIQAGPQSQLTIASLTHGGEWYAGRNYRPLQMLASSLPEGGPLRLTVADAAAPSGLGAAGARIARLAGRKGLSLSEAETAALKKFLDDGGLLLAEATMGEAAFDQPFRSLAASLGLQLKELTAESPLLSGQMGTATGYAIGQVGYKYALRAERIGKPLPLLYGLYRGDKMVGLYSPFDLSYSQTGFDAWACRGYEDEDALAILTNFLLWASTQ
ncbi:MAG: DUF4159 domain-containing protein [Planctomycetes bacterium]|nr:DUF4159 domain-containing protein [Planctomycetota bacterium]